MEHKGDRSFDLFTVQPPSVWEEESNYGRIMEESNYEAEPYWTNGRSVSSSMVAPLDSGFGQYSYRTIPHQPYQPRLPTPQQVRSVLARDSPAWDSVADCAVIEPAVRGLVTDIVMELRRDIASLDYKPARRRANPHIPPYNTSTVPYHTRIPNASRVPYSAGTVPYSTGRPSHHPTRRPHEPTSLTNNRARLAQSSYVPSYSASGRRVGDLSTLSSLRSRLQSMPRGTAPPVSVELAEHAADALMEEVLQQEVRECVSRALVDTADGMALGGVCEHVLEWMVKELTTEVATEVVSARCIEAASREALVHHTPSQLPITDRTVGDRDSPLSRLVQMHRTQPGSDEPLPHDVSSSLLFTSLTVPAVFESLVRRLPERGKPASQEHRVVGTRPAMSSVERVLTTVRRQAVAEVVTGRVLQDANDAVAPPPALTMNKHGINVQNVTQAVALMRRIESSMQQDQ